LSIVRSLLNRRLGLGLAAASDDQERDQGDECESTDNSTNNGAKRCRLGSAIGVGWIGSRSTRSGRRVWSWRCDKILSAPGECHRVKDIDDCIAARSTIGDEAVSHGGHSHVGREHGYIARDCNGLKLVGLARVNGVDTCRSIAHLNR